MVLFAQFRFGPSGPSFDYTTTGGTTLTMTKQDAMNAKYRDEFIYSKPNGKVIRARVNGACKVWKTRPEEFRLPMIHGFWYYFYIDQYNAADWSPAR